MLGQRVFDLRWHLPMDLSAQDARLLELTKLLGERPVRDSFELPMELAEPMRSLEEVVQNENLPPTADDAECRLDRA